MSVILIAEDTLEIQELLALILTDEGHKVVTANDGLEALEWLNGNPLPDLLITDFQMPKINGAALVASIRLDSRLKQLPIIVASGSHMDEIAKAFIKQEVIFMPKPFDLGNVIEVVTRTISEHKGE
jgi:CheY-like chemotaxis protein